MKRILVLGASPRVPRMLMELVGFFKSIDVTVLARATESFGTLAHDVQAMFLNVWNHAPQIQGPEGPSYRMVFDTEEHRAKLDLLEVDWTHAHLLSEAASVTLESADAVLILPGPHAESGSDGEIALDCLHIAHLERTGARKLKSERQVLAMVDDPGKGDLLARRLAELDDGGGPSRYTVISQQRARHWFITQGVFVRGLSSIYLDLLDFRGQYLSRLLPTWPDGDPPESFDPWQLAAHFFQRRGQIFIGYETRGDNGEHRVVVDPALLGPNRSQPWSEVTALYVLGRESDSDDGATTSLASKVRGSKLDPDKGSSPGPAS